MERFSGGLEWSRTESCRQGLWEGHPAPGHPPALCPVVPEIQLIKSPWKSYILKPLEHHMGFSSRLPNRCPLCNLFSALDAPFFELPKPLNPSFKALSKGCDLRAVVLCPPPAPWRQAWFLPCFSCDSAAAIVFGTEQARKDSFLNVWVSQQAAEKSGGAVKLSWVVVKPTFWSHHWSTPLHLLSRYKNGLFSPDSTAWCEGLLQEARKL